ncbi:MAG: SAM-dependent chlorinase/fluorinase [bacterium]
MAIITLQTDFGTRDPFVAAMKGVILRQAPDVQIVDVTHEIPPYNRMLPGLHWCGIHEYFPPGTVHVAVVDPGVGTSRAILAVAIFEQIFLCPDNGLITPLLRGSAPRECFRVERKEWFAPDPHPTFHGRDIFAPVAAHLAMGEAIESVGPRHKPQLDHWPVPLTSPEAIQTSILTIDHFGNAWTSMCRGVWGHTDWTDATVAIEGVDISIPTISRTYGDQPAGTPVALFNSSGFLEIAEVQGNAAASFGLSLGQKVTVTRI